MFPQLDSGLTVLTFLPVDDQIVCINKAMAFLSDVFSPRYPLTNNQLRSSNNQGIKPLFKMVKSLFNKFREDKCTQPKRRRDATWCKEKVLLVQAHAEGKELDEVQLAFLVDLRVADGQVAQTITHNAAFQIDDLDAYDYDCDDTKAILMANLLSCDSDALSGVQYSKTFQNDMMNQSVQELQYFEQTPIVDYPDNEITSDSNIIPYSQYLETNTFAQQVLYNLGFEYQSVTPPKRVSSEYVQTLTALKTVSKQAGHVDLAVSDLAKVQVIPAYNIH
ncbi:hypothetical protein Tco_1238447 [Tanacetum coccineum]